MVSAPWLRVRVMIGVPWYPVEVRGRLRGMPWKMSWKVLPQVGGATCREKRQ